MSYYNVLSAASALLLQQNHTMRRCRRRFNGPHRYVIFAAHGQVVHFSETEKSRRMGYTLQELLEWLASRPHSSAATEARTLLQELEVSYQVKVKAAI